MIETSWTLPTTCWERQSEYLAPGRRMSDLPPVDRSWSHVRIHVLRNHPVELPMRMAQRFAGYLGLAMTTTYSGYDDSFAFLGNLPDADAILIWPDWSRIESGERSEILDRLTQARTDLPTGMVIDPTGLDEVFVARIRSAAHRAGMSVVELPTAEVAGDTRMATMVGSDRPMSWQLAVGSSLGIGWLAGLLLPPLKLLVLDLDHTLYAGTLGEDGPAGLRFTDEHLALLMLIADLQNSGVLIVIVTKNDERDMPGLQAAWPATGFQLASAARILASWDAKADRIRALVDELGFDERSVMFLDDNPGEIATVLASVPGLWPVLANDPTEAAAVLRMQRGRVTREDTTAGARADDLQAGEARRAAMHRAASPAELHASLRTCVGIRRADAGDVERVADLLARTNQFNLALARLPVDAVQDRLTSPIDDVAIARVADRLADSGVVAVGVGRRHDDAVLFEEVALSCRVLGRDLESLLVLGLADAIRGEQPIDAVDFIVRIGPRNEPAMTWLGALNGTAIVEDGTYRVPVSVLAEAAARVRPGVTVEEGGGSDGSN